MGLTHIQKLQLETHDGIVLLRGQTMDGDAMYVYVRANASQIEDIFRASQTGEAIDFGNFGGIIKLDWGEEPSSNVKIYMERYYNFIHPQE